METLNPLNALAAWFSSQPPEVKQDLAALVVMSIPGTNVSTSSQVDIEPAERFEKWLGEHASLASTFKHVGAALCARAAIEFFVMRNRGTKEAWKEIVASNKGVRERFLAEGRSPENIDKMLLRSPFREKLWLKSTESWRFFCSGQLSDAALDRWVQKGGSRSA